ncbi:hypothetical protein MUK42_18538 [Musa troglodytarum]|nr:hypothetical protein MUK42_18538 [Musa troglodytarum]
MQLSPRDSRLTLSSHNAQLAVFHPNVDEISLIIVNTTTNPSVQSIFLFYLLYFNIHINQISQSS